MSARLLLRDLRLFAPDALERDVELPEVVRQARLDGDAALVVRHPDGHLALALLDGAARPEEVNVYPDDRDLAEHALHLLLLDDDARRDLVDAAGVADGDVECLPRGERERAEEVDGRDDVLRRAFEGGGDDARRLL